MKSFYLASIILVLLLVWSCKGIKEKIPLENVDQTELAIIEKFNSDFFTSLPAGDTMEFDGRLTNIMENVFNKNNYVSLYETFNEQMGIPEKIEWQETWHMKNTREYNVYRFKAYPPSTKEIWEIRVSIDPKGLIAGYWIFPWNDALLEK